MRCTVSQGSEDLSFTRQQQQLGVFGQKLGSRLEVCTTMGWWKSDRFNQKSRRFHKKICGNGDRCCGNAKGWNYAGAVGILLGCSLLCIWKIEYKIHVQVLKYWANCPIKMSQVASKYVVDS